MFSHLQFMNLFLLLLSLGGHPGRLFDFDQCVYGQQLWSRNSHVGIVLYSAFLKHPVQRRHVQHALEFGMLQVLVSQWRQNFVQHLEANDMDFNGV